MRHTKYYISPFHIEFPIMDWLIVKHEIIP